MNETEVGKILSQISDKFYRQMNRNSDEFKRSENTWLNIIDDINDTGKNIQDVILESGKHPLYKQKGIWVEQKNRAVLDNDLINFFLVFHAQESVEGRQKSTPTTAVVQDDILLYDEILTDLLLTLYNKSYIFSLSVENKILRCILYSVISTGKDDERFAISIRVQPKKLPEIETIHVPMDITKLVDMNTGLNLISGFSGNGKTWTLSALINYFNQNLNTIKVIGTIEEPIEFIYKNINAHIIQREVLKNTPSFKDASTDALRQGHDIVVFGELREKEEMYNALMLAESGKQVFATIHSNSPADTIDRFISEFDSEKQQNIRERLLENITMILHQELIRYNNNQYPVVDMLLIKNKQERERFKKIAQTRNSLAKAVDDGAESWIINSKDAYKELVRRGILSENQEVKEIFRA